MSIITIKQKGDFKKADAYFKALNKSPWFNVLDKYGKIGVDALAKATPVDTGKTASSWEYKIEKKKDQITISWNNTNVVDDVPIAVILQYGHGTGNGGYVHGKDYIRPALKEVFEKLANEAWEEVSKL